MSYVLDNVLKNERFLHEAKIHWSIFFSLKSLLTLTIWAWIVRSSGEFAVTNRRVIIKIGIVQRRTLELNLSKVESIEVEQTVWGRLFGYGDIEVIGTGGTREQFSKIGDPLGFRKAVAEATEAVAGQRGLPADQPVALAPVAADPQDRLATAQTMRDQGLMTSEEYEQVRQRILSEI